MPLMTQAEYARQRGCSKQAVSKAVKAGRLTLIDGRIDPEIADREWARNTDPDQQQRGAPEQFEVTQARVQTSVRRDPAHERDVGDPMLVEAKARTEKLRADLLEIEIREKRGELVEADQVRRVNFNLARTTRNALLALPARLAPLLAPIADASEIERLLEAEIRKVCVQLASTPATEQ
jgi:phage terminase Nu1 subunit (DNA packaging protein)